MHKIINVIKNNDPLLWSIISVIVVCCGIFIYQDYQSYEKQIEEQKKLQQLLRDEYRNQIMQELNRIKPRHPSLKNIPRTYIL
jgi:DNA-directed RNA polymerase subunit N (RpoN/RPB10)